MSSSDDVQVLIASIMGLPTQAKFKVLDALITAGLQESGGVTYTSARRSPDGRTTWMILATMNQKLIAMLERFFAEN